MKHQMLVITLLMVSLTALTAGAQSLENMVDILGTPAPSPFEMRSEGFDAERYGDDAILYSVERGDDTHTGIMAFIVQNSTIRAIAVGGVSTEKSVSRSMVKSCKKQVYAVARKKRFRVQDLEENGARAGKGTREFGIVFLTPQVFFIYATDTGTDFFMPE